MSEKIIQLNEEVIKGQIKEIVRGSVEETLNELLEVEAAKLTQAARYERNEQRQGCRSGHFYALRAAALRRLRSVYSPAGSYMTATSPLLPEASLSRCPSSRGFF